MEIDFNTSFKVILHCTPSGMLFTCGIGLKTSEYDILTSCASWSNLSLAASCSMCMCIKLTTSTPITGLHIASTSGLHLSQVSCNSASKSLRCSTFFTTTSHSVGASAQGFIGRLGCSKSKPLELMAVCS